MLVYRFQYGPYIWLRNNAPVSFQLTYNKQANEHAISWSSHISFSHNRVDSAETITHLKYKMSPILMPDGKFDAVDTTAMFMQANEDIDETIAKEPLIYSERSRLWSKMFRFKARIARNS